MKRNTKNDQLDDDGNPKYPSDPTNLNLEPSEFNNTEKITGKNNIEKSIKDNIKFYLSYPYYVRVDVLKVIVNKMDVDTDVYRYTGGKRKKGQIEYFKAWNYSLFTQPPHEGRPSRSAHAASASAPPFQSGGGDWSRFYMGCREPRQGIEA